MRLSLLIITLLLTAGCANQPTQPPKAQPERDYETARKAQVAGDHANAIKYFSRLEHQHPTSPQARLAPLEIAYANYKLQDYDQASAELERFMSANPDHSNLDYAYFLKGLIRTAQGFDRGNREIQQPEQVRDAYQQFAALAQKYPASSYRATALEQMTRLRNGLARHELGAVTAKLAEGDQEGAFRHAKFISENYTGSPAAREALELINSAAAIMIPAAPAAIAVITPMPEAKTEAGVSPEMAPAAVSESAAERREAWLLQQEPAHYTLQLAASGNRENLRAFAVKHNLQERSAYFQHQHNQTAWFTLLYGSYNDKMAAVREAQQLKNEHGIDDIWIRPFADIQMIINDQTSTK